MIRRRVVVIKADFSNPQHILCALPQETDFTGRPLSIVTIEGAKKVDLLRFSLNASNMHALSTLCIVEILIFFFSF